LKFAGSVYDPFKRTLNGIPIEKILKSKELLIKTVGKTIISS